MIYDGEYCHHLWASISNHLFNMQLILHHSQFILLFTQFFDYRKIALTLVANCSQFMHSLRNLNDALFNCLLSILVGSSKLKEQ